MTVRKRPGTPGTGTGGIGGLHLTRLGSDQWDEVLAIDYDEEHDILYVAGSTLGDLCQAFPDQAADGCTASEQNRAVVSGGTAGGSKFDSYVMAVRWDGERFVLASVLQLGRPAEDTFNALKFWRASGVTGVDDGDYIYVGGKFDSDPADGRVVLDKVVHRIRVNPDAASDRDVIESETLITYEDTSAPGTSESVQGIEVTETHVYVSGGRNLTSAATHAGPCAGGTASAGIATVDKFAHPPTGGGFVKLITFDSPPPPTDDAPGHDAADAKSLTISGGELYLIGQTALPPTAACGAEINLDHDDDLDMVIYRHAL